MILISQEKELRLREEEIRIKEALAYAVFQEQFGSKHVPLGIEEKQGKERESFQKDNVQVVDVVLCKDQSTQQVKGSTLSTVDTSTVPYNQQSLLINRPYHNPQYHTILQHNITKYYFCFILS
jgi:hypothetical protein